MFSVFAFENITLLISTIIVAVRLIVAGNDSAISRAVSAQEAN